MIGTMWCVARNLRCFFYLPLGAEHTYFSPMLCNVARAVRSLSYQDPLPDHPLTLLHLLCRPAVVAVEDETGSNVFSRCSVAGWGGVGVGWGGL